MSCSKYLWKPECDSHLCFGDCDYCSYAKDEDEEETEDE